MTDLTNPKLIKLKGILFLVMGLLSSILLLIYAPTLKVAFLLIVAIWSFCRFYYFAFYVIQHYIDPNYKFSGLGNFARYMIQQKRRPADSKHDQSAV